MVLLLVGETLVELGPFVVNVSLANDEYIRISSSCLGNDQKIIRFWTGSGMRSYFCSIDWKGIYSATILALRSNSECGAPSPEEEEA